MRAKKDMKEVLKPYVRKWKWEGGVDALLEYWFGDGAASQEMSEIVKDLRNRNIKLVLCTNNEKRRINFMLRKLSLDALFDFIVASYNVGATKPDRKMLKSVIEISGYEPREIAFFDDDAGHVKAAAKVGMRAFVFKNTKDFRKKLDVLLESKR